MKRSTAIVAGLPWALSAMAVLSGCASEPASLVTLLPQADGRPSAVTITTPRGAQALDQPYQVAKVARGGDIEPATTTAHEVREAYPQLIALQIPPPERFVLEFLSSTSDLTAESLAQVDGLIAKARARSGGEITVTGHTDRQGSVEANDALSLQRAQAVRELLIQRGFAPELLQAVGRGEREPLVPTEDEVAEPRNRRAELVVR